MTGNKSNTRTPFFKKRITVRYLHWELTADQGNVIRVDLDSQANVMLLDDSNYRPYQDGGRFKFQGGLAKRSSVALSPPHQGRWHVVVDLGGYGRQAKANVTVI
jgi:hypothetical protein